MKDYVKLHESLFGPLPRIRQMEPEPIIWDHQYKLDAKPIGDFVDTAGAPKPPRRRSFPPIPQDREKVTYKTLNPLGREGFFWTPEDVEEVQDALQTIKILQEENRNLTSGLRNNELAYLSRKIEQTLEIEKLNKRVAELEPLTENPWNIGRISVDHQQWLEERSRTKYFHIWHWVWFVVALSEFIVMGWHLTTCHY